CPRPRFQRGALPLSYLGIDLHLCITTKCRRISPKHSAYYELIAEAESYLGVITSPSLRSPERATKQSELRLLRALKCPRNDAGLFL
ncbi:MAG: hypothetical protein NTY34_07540, partial [Candidatus Omnitrophica bacterium]|nr:hypothetical protein [Candidatus Omnitrophota bacterium]